jgi:PPOX class probable F420-dependent enzyme
VFERWQETLLASARVARLGTIAQSGEPHLVPVCFAQVDGDFAIAIDEKPKRQDRPLARTRNIERDPRVTLLVDYYEDADWSKLAWIRINGEASILPRGEAWPAALSELRGRYEQYDGMRLEELPLIRIHPSRVTGWRWTG